MKKALKLLKEEGFTAKIVGNYIEVSGVRPNIVEQLFIARDGSISTDVLKNGEEIGCRNFSDIEEYVFS